MSSLNAGYGGGRLLTHPLTFAGQRMEINYATSAAGHVRVELQEADGTPIPGFALADCPEIIGDEIERIVSWKNGSDISRLAERPVRLCFAIKDADLYALQFKE